VWKRRLGKTHIVIGASARSGKERFPDLSFPSSPSPRRMDVESASPFDRAEQADFSPHLVIGEEEIASLFFFFFLLQHETRAA